MRPSGMSISDYVMKLEQLCFEAKSFHMEILDGILAYKLLIRANNEQKQLIKATVSKMDYQIKKDQLKKVFPKTNKDRKGDFETETEIEKSDVLLSKMSP